jgi:predicted metal-dependent phosphoesterase TrpH
MNAVDTDLDANLIATLNADLHCHSMVSDGLMTPAEVVRRAHANGTEMLALTDHDELSGLAEARAAADEVGLRFIDGVEISVTWDNDTTLHVVGLDIDPTHAGLCESLAHLRSGRDRRAMQMSDELDKVGIHGAYQGALRFVSNPSLVSRAHFARYIVEIGRAKDVKSVFDYWLGKDKPGYVRHVWASLEEAVAWIRDAGGVAAIAHPLRYKISRKELRRLFGEFRDLGGEAIEVLSGGQCDADTLEFARLAREFGFLASRGSDFHGPGESRIDLGKLQALPEGLTPVWTKFID